MRQLVVPIAFELELAAPAEAVSARFGSWITATPVTADRCVVEMTADSFEWPTFVVASLGVEVVVRAPAEFGDHLAHLGRILTRAG